MSKTKTRRQIAEELSSFLTEQFWKCRYLKHLGGGKRWMSVGAFSISWNSVQLCSSAQPIPRIDIWRKGHGKVMSACWPPFILISMKGTDWVDILRTAIVTGVPPHEFNSNFKGGVCDGGHGLSAIKELLRTVS